MWSIRENPNIFTFSLVFSKEFSRKLDTEFTNQCEISYFKLSSEIDK